MQYSLSLCHSLELLYVLLEGHLFMCSYSPFEQKELSDPCIYKTNAILFPQHFFLDINDTYIHQIKWIVNFLGNQNYMLHLEDDKTLSIAQTTI